VVALLLLSVLATALLAARTVGAEVLFEGLPALPIPPEYGNILMDRLSTKNRAKPVMFRHWTHRLRYTCRVCHFELEFEFKAGATPITERDNLVGGFCGACHDGNTAFDHGEDNCDRCHTGNVSRMQKKFDSIYKKLPHTRYGNRIDWVRAERITHPKYSLFSHEKPMGFEKELLLQAEMAIIPPAVFPHEQHTRVLDCSNCHPEIFNIKKKSTPHFSMDYILEKKFCGRCHYNVAFPLDDCKRCHPGMRGE
jgi:c(7)-type cytochrome triheme protein